VLARPRGSVVAHEPATVTAVAAATLAAARREGAKARAVAAGAHPQADAIEDSIERGRPAGGELAQQATAPFAAARHESPSLSNAFRIASAIDALPIAANPSASFDCACVNDSREPCPPKPRSCAARAFGRDAGCSGSAVGCHGGGTNAGAPPASESRTVGGGVFRRGLGGAERRASVPSPSARSAAQPGRPRGHYTARSANFPAPAPSGRGARLGCAARRGARHRRSSLGSAEPASEHSAADGPRLRCGGSSCVRSTAVATDGRA
jgi:hypothetical protein